MPLPVQAYNLATGNKWLLVIPFHKVLTDTKSTQLAFNLVNFSIPDFSIGSTEFPIRGASFPLPTTVRNESKSITFFYLLSSDWYQYKFLYKWFNMIANEEGGGQLPKYGNLDMTVYMLTEFKNVRFYFTFYGCWLQSLGSLDLNYQTGENNVMHSFTCMYAYYKIHDLIT